MGYHTFAITIYNTNLCSSISPYLASLTLWAIWKKRPNLHQNHLSSTTEPDQPLQTPISHLDAVAATLSVFAISVKCWKTQSTQVKRQHSMFDITGKPQNNSCHHSFFSQRYNFFLICNWYQRTIIKSSFCPLRERRNNNREKGVHLAASQIFQVISN